MNQKLKMSVIALFLTILSGGVASAEEEYCTTIPDYGTVCCDGFRCNSVDADEVDEAACTNDSNQCSYYICRHRWPPAGCI